MRFKDSKWERIQVTEAERQEISLNGSWRKCFSGLGIEALKILLARAYIREENIRRELKKISYDLKFGGEK